MIEEFQKKSKLNMYVCSGDSPEFITFCLKDAQKRLSPYIDEFSPDGSPTGKSWKLVCTSLDEECVLNKNCYYSDTF